MQCFPLESILTAMGNPTVNLFILDIEGYELAVLQTIPWDKVDIEVSHMSVALVPAFFFISHQPPSFYESFPKVSLN